MVNPCLSKDVLENSLDTNEDGRMPSTVQKKMVGLSTGPLTGESLSKTEGSVYAVLSEKGLQATISKA